VAGNDTISVIMPIRWVVCDWGNTLMRDFGLPGPMAGWPEVEVLPGAADALALLRRNCRLAVASNAAESDAALIRRALDRGGIGSFFEAVFSSREMGAAKPDPAFFRMLLDRLRISGPEGVSIGDDLHKDILPARAAGMRTILLDPDGHAGPVPEADAVAASWSEMPGLIAHLDDERSQFR
jgi:FMN phosphatase YigB (HAD superfamily)